MGNDKEKVDEDKGPGKLDTGKIVVFVKNGNGARYSGIPVNLFKNGLLNTTNTINGVATFDPNGDGPYLVYVQGQVQSGYVYSQLDDNYHTFIVGNIPLESIIKS